MTVLIAVAAKPIEKGLSPYLFFGSDSKRVQYIMQEDGIILEGDIDENYKKVTKICNGKKLMAISGMYPGDLHQDIIGEIENNNQDIEELTEIVFKYIEIVIRNTDLPTAKCTVIIGSCDNSDPIFAHIEVDNQDIENPIKQVVKTETGHFSCIFAGSTTNTEELQSDFETRLRNNNLNQSVTRKAVKDYIIGAARLHPNSCNEIIQYEVLK